MDAAYHCHTDGRPGKMEKKHLFPAFPSQDSLWIIEHDDLIEAFYLFMLILRFAEHHQRWCLFIRAES